MYIKYTTTVTTKEFHKDLAKIRGYWAVYGAKELDTNTSYPYYRLQSSDNLYDITVAKSGTKYSWSIINDSSSGIKDDDIFKRTLTSSDNEKMESYVYTP
jgi:hypothetical protein